MPIKFYWRWLDEIEKCVRDWVYSLYRLVCCSFIIRLLIYVSSYCESYWFRLYFKTCSDFRFVEVEEVEEWKEKGKANRVKEKLGFKTFSSSIIIRCTFGLTFFLPF